MRWESAHKYDPRGAALADRHYSRGTVGAPQFCPPGRTVVLVVDELAVWVSSLQRHVRHAWPGAWVCSLFRNEGAGLSSELIREAVAATRAIWGAPPPAGMVTFVDVDEVRPKRDPGRCFRRAGFRPAGWTADGRPKGRGPPLLVLRLDPSDMPAPELARGAGASLFGAA